jgi:hypothetical protein
MDTTDVKKAVQDLILTNHDDLVAGIDGGGVQRNLHQVARSNLSALDGWYHVAVRVTAVREQSQPQRAGTTRNPTREAEYDVEVLVIDEAQVAFMDENQYEGMHDDFNLLTDRIANLFRDQTGFISSLPNGSQKYELRRTGTTSDRLIRMRDESGTALDTESNEWASLFMRISFTLIDKCVA